MTNKVSKETQEQAIKVAKGIQKKGQTKEQTKLIAQGIEKGLAEYKKQQGKKSRERDKDRKQQIKQKQRLAGETVEPTEIQKSTNLPWILLILSWFCFVGYVFLS